MVQFVHFNVPDKKAWEKTFAWGCYCGANVFDLELNVFWKCFNLFLQTNKQCDFGGKTMCRDPPTRVIFHQFGAIIVYNYSKVVFKQSKAVFKICSETS